MKRKIRYILVCVALLGMLSSAACIVSCVRQWEEQTETAAVVNGQENTVHKDKFHCDIILCEFIIIAGGYLLLAATDTSHKKHYRNLERERHAV